MKTILYGVLVLVAAAFAVIYWQNAQAPGLGVADGKLKPLGSRPNQVSTQAADESRKVATLPMKSSLEQTRQAILAAIQVYSYGSVEVLVDEPRYIYAVFTTPTMKYRDDVEFYIDTTQSVVHFRSASRAGYSDRGLNRERYDALAKSYRAWQG